MGHAELNTLSEVHQPMVEIVLKRQAPLSSAALQHLAAIGDWEIDQ
jgi:hypothetical protein